MSLFNLVSEGFPGGEVRVRIFPVPGVRGEASRNICTTRREECDHTKLPEEDPSQKVSGDTKTSGNPSSGHPPLVRGDELETEHESLKSGFGLLPRVTRFTRRASRTLKRVGAAFDVFCPREECLFLTGTLPGSTDGAFRSIAEWSGYIVHRLKAWVAKRQEAKMDFYCWEWQKRGALHLHYVVHLPDRHCREEVRRGFHAEWVSLLESVSVRSGNDLFARGDGRTWAGATHKVRATAEVVRKSVARYMGKYLSKASGSTLSGYCPSRWWGASREACDKLEALTVRRSQEFLSKAKAQALYDNLCRFLEATSEKGYLYRSPVGEGRSGVFFFAGGENHYEVIMTAAKTNSAYVVIDRNGETARLSRVYIRSLVLRVWNVFRTNLNASSEPLAAKVLKIAASSEEIDVLTLHDLMELRAMAAELQKTGYRGEWLKDARRVFNELISLSSVRQSNTDGDHAASEDNRTSVTIGNPEAANSVRGEVTRVQLRLEI